MKRLLQQKLNMWWKVDRQSDNNNLSYSKLELFIWTFVGRAAFSHSLCWTEGSSTVNLLLRRQQLLPAETLMGNIMMIRPPTYRSCRPTILHTSGPLYLSPLDQSAAGPSVQLLSNCHGFSGGYESEPAVNTCSGFCTSSRWSLQNKWKSESACEVKSFVYYLNKTASVQESSV